MAPSTQRPGDENSRSPMKKTIFSLALLLMLYLAFEGLSMLGLVGLARFKGISYQPISLSLSPESRDRIQAMLAGRFTYHVHDPFLGWTLRPNGTSDIGRTNSQAIRADREFELTPPVGFIRVSAFGDSFTHGDEVRTENTWEESLMRIDPRLEVLNFGVAGYGLDQAFLRYQRDGVRFRSHIVLIGFLSENIFRSVNVFRPFYTHYGPSLAKPRFIVVDEELLLIENPLPDPSDYVRLLNDEANELTKLGQNDFFFNKGYHQNSFDLLPSVRILKVLANSMSEQVSTDSIIKQGEYNPESEAFKVTLRLFDEFYRLCLENDSTPIVLLFPGRRDFNRRSRRYGILLEHLARSNYRYIDLMDAFESYGWNGDFDPFFMRGHYSPLGNRIVAEWISEYLQENDLLE